MKRIPQTIDDLRNPKRKSGFDHVNAAQGPGRKPSWRASWNTGESVPGRAQQNVKQRGPARRDPAVAAQDVVDIAQGLPLDAVVVRAADLRPQRRLTTTVTSTRKTGFPEAMKKAIHARADGMCENCGEEFPYREAHHIDPDGDHSMDNGSSLCPNCHAVTSRGTPEEAEEINARLRALRAAENPPAAVQQAA